MSAVCGSCQSTVVREGVDLHRVGSVSAFARDLSPVQVGARGVWGGKSFTVLGVLRKARERVRWNEWFLGFDGGETGWLGEGNGQFHLFVGEPVEVPPSSLPSLRPGGTLRLEGVEWRVMEAATARIVAAEGQLPYPVVDGQSFDYADLRAETGSGFGTLDREGETASFYVGRTVSLPKLAMEGLRLFSGWSDPSLVAFAGPEITAVRTASCPSCAAPLSLRAPGATTRIVCQYCGSALDPGDGGEGSALTLVANHEMKVWKPTLPLGSFGRIRDVPYGIIGAMMRFVAADGEKFFWTEYLLYNPYHGCLWLVEDGGSHWNLVRLCDEVPETGASLSTVTLRSQRFRCFQSGEAHVDRVIGEFTWEVHAGDKSYTSDYIAPPQMLSYEKNGQEIAWSLGVYWPKEAVESTFGIRPLATPRGIAPHQPNPFGGSGPWGMTFLHAGLIGGLTLLLLVAQTLLFPSKSMTRLEGTVDCETEQAWVSPSFTVSSSRDRNLNLDLISTLSPKEASLAVVLVDVDHGRSVVVEMGKSKGSTTSPWNANGAVGLSTEGKYLARVEMAKDPSKGGQPCSGSVKLQVKQAGPWRTPLVLTLFFSLCLPLIHLFASLAFEARRWQESDET